MPDPTSVSRWSATDVALKAPANKDQADQARVGQVLGQEFLDNARPVATSATVCRSGWTSLPTHSRGTAVHQYLFVNDRPVKDKLLTGVIRAVYRELMPHGRHPMLALWLDVQPGFVDVNVHPAKLRSASGIPPMYDRLLLTPYATLLSGGPQTTSGLTDDALAAFSQVQTVGETSGGASDTSAMGAPLGYRAAIVPWFSGQSLCW